MIEQVSITDYKCFQGVAVPLAPLTVLIGENNTGKSTFLEALGLLRGNPKFKGDGALTFQGKGESATVRIVAGTAPPTVSRLSLPAAGPRMTSAGIPDSSEAPPLTPDTVAAYMDWLLRRDRERFDQVVAAMREAIPGLQDLNIETPEPATRRLRLRWEGRWEADANETSAGTRILMFFLALLWHPHPPHLLLVEEPENGLHPKRLAQVMGILHDVCAQKHSPTRVQIVVSTHSPYLLDLADPDRDQLLVFTRSADGSCVARPLAKERIRVFLDEFNLGEVWTNEGEAGLT